MKIFGMGSFEAMILVPIAIVVVLVVLMAAKKR